MARVVDNERNDSRRWTNIAARSFCMAAFRACCRLSLFGALGLLWSTDAALAAPSFTASLDRNVVPVGETVTLSLAFEGVTPPSSPSLPTLPNLSLTPGVSQSSEFSFVNGQQTSRQTYSYT